ncbi:MAG: hypothetical protein WAM21_13290 [Steroidobacteraceae bacterium]
MEHTMRKAFLTAISVLVINSLQVCTAATLKQFPTPVQAQAHCPHETVVWLNLPTMIWHWKGERWYGRTKHGAFVCEKEAKAAGARATRNGE